MPIDSISQTLTEMAAQAADNYFPEYKEANSERQAELRDKALGIAISKATQWDTHRVGTIAAAMLEDSNVSLLAAEIREMLCGDEDETDEDDYDVKTHQTPTELTVTVNNTFTVRFSVEPTGAQNAYMFRSDSDEIPMRDMEEAIQWALDGYITDNIEEDTDEN